MMALSLGQQLALFDKPLGLAILPQACLYHLLLEGPTPQLRHPETKYVFRDFILDICKWH